MRMQKMKKGMMDGSMQEMDFGEMMYEDDFCGVVFDNKKDFDQHMKEYHCKGTRGKMGRW